MQTFKVDTLKELTNVTRTGTFTVVGGVAATPSSLSVTGTGVGSGSAVAYADKTWARTNITLADGNNSWTASAQNSAGASDSSSVTAYLPASPTLKYDLNGNLTNDSQRVFEYDYENQLTNVYVASTWQESLTYDAFGRKRVLKQYKWQSGAWSLTNEVRYVYDGMLVVQERSSANAPLVTYTRGLDLSRTRQGAGGIGGLLARTEHTNFTLNPQLSTYLYHSDGGGNITALVSTNGLILAKYSYDSFGNLLAATGPLADANLYRFSSKEWHPLSGLYYYGFRFYEPQLQRWLNRDPIQEYGGINLYGFVFNDPVRFVDSWGLSSDPWGHHTVCQALTKGVGDDLKSVFNDPKARIANPLYNEHNGKRYNGYSAKDYSDAFKEKLDAFVTSKKKKTIADLSVPEAQEFVDKIRKSKGVIGNYNSGVTDEMNRVVAARTKFASGVSKLKGLAAASAGMTVLSATSAIASNPNYQEAIDAANAGDLGGVDNAMFDLATDIAFEAGDSRILPGMYGTWWWLKKSNCD